MIGVCPSRIIDLLFVQNVFSTLSWGSVEMKTSHSSSVHALDWLRLRESQRASQYSRSPSVDIASRSDAYECGQKRFLRFGGGPVLQLSACPSSSSSYTSVLVCGRTSGPLSSLSLAFSNWNNSFLKDSLSPPLSGCNRKARL